jgi:positive regulator of sigma E activity
MNSNRALLVAVPAILIFVLALTYLRVFSSVVVIAVIVVLYILVSFLNRRKFGKRAAERDASSKRTGT